MIPIGFVLENADLPQTVYYRLFKDAVRGHRWYRDTNARIAIPAEDTAHETNWPRYGDPASAYCRGSMDDESAGEAVNRYLIEVVGYAMSHPDVSLVVLNMDPSRRMPAAFRPIDNLIVADGALAADERLTNPRTISMPALPFVRSHDHAAPRTVLASFHGVRSHPVREALARLDDGDAFVIRLVDPANHVGRIDAERGIGDAAYEGLLDRSVFAFVPRGDSRFSYRLVEAMARGAIPVVVSDGWVLPFDRTVDWPACSVSVSEAAVDEAPALLGRFSASEIAELQANLRHVHQTTFADLPRMVAALAGESARLIA